MSFRNGFPRGFLNGAGLPKYPRLQAKTGVCSVQVEQYPDVSVEVDKNVLQKRSSEGMRDTLCPFVEVLDDSLPFEEL